jgi:hypothetical protein
MNAVDIKEKTCTKESVNFMNKDDQKLDLQKENELIDIGKNLISLIANESVSLLLDRIIEAEVNLECLEDFEKYLWELYEKESYSTILAIIKSLYILNGFIIPESLEKIIQSDKQELYSSFIYELLMDMNESIVDFENDI